MVTCIPELGGVGRESDDMWCREGECLHVLQSLVV